MEADSLFDIIAAPAPRKVSRRERNDANYLQAWVAETWPELVELAIGTRFGGSGVWITGSHVWPHLYGEFPPEGADLDMFTTTLLDFEATLAFLQSISTTPDMPRPPSAKSRAANERSARVHTTRGWVDLWFTNKDPIEMVKDYPTEGYAHCRAAYHPHTRTLIVVANEAAP